MVVGKACVGSQVDLHFVLFRVKAVLQSALGLDSVPALGTSGHVEKETQDGAAPGVEAASGSWHLDSDVRIQPVVAGLDHAQIEKTRQLGWLDLKLGSPGVDGSLNFELLGEVDVSLVRRINYLSKWFLRFCPSRILWRT